MYLELYQLPKAMLEFALRHVSLYHLRTWLSGPIMAAQFLAVDLPLWHKYRRFINLSTCDEDKVEDVCPDGLRTIAENNDSPCRVFSTNLDQQIVLSCLVPGEVGKDAPDIHCPSTSQFIQVVRGMVEIRVWDGDGSVTARTLGAGDVVTIGGIAHAMTALSSTAAKIIIVYSPPFLPLNTHE